MTQTRTPNRYVIIGLTVEILFQWEIMSNFQHFCDHKDDDYDKFGAGVALVMVVSHFLYISAAAVELLMCVRRGENGVVGSAKISVKPCDTSDWAKTQSKHSHDDIGSKVEETGQDAIPPPVLEPTKVDDDDDTVKKKRRKPKRRRSSLERFSQHHTGLGGSGGHQMSLTPSLRRTQNFV